MSRDSLHMPALVEKSMIATFGMWLLIHEVADDVIREIIDRGKSAPTNARTLLDEFASRVEGEKEQVREKLSGVFATALRDGGYATQADLKDLHRRLESLESQLAALERKIDERRG